MHESRADIADLLAAGAVDAAAQRALLAIDAASPPPAAVTSALHFVSLAVRYATEGQRTAAREAFDHALDIAAGESDDDDLRPRLYRNVAAALAAAGSHASAARCLEAAIERGAHGPVVWQRLGRYRLNAGDAAGALQALDHAQRLNPTAEMAADRVLAELELAPSRDTASRALARLQASRPDRATVRWDYALGCAHRQAGDAPAARASFRRALEHTQGDLAAHELASARAGA